MAHAILEEGKGVLGNGNKFNKINLLYFCLFTPLVISIIFHGLAIIQFRSTVLFLNLPAHYPTQYYSLLTFSFLLSITVAVLHLFRLRQSYLLLPLSFQFFSLILIGLPMGDYLGIEFSLLTVLLFETTLFFNFPLTIFLSSGVIIINLAFQQPIYAWDKIYPRASFNDLLLFGIYALALGFALNSLKYYLESVVEKSELIAQLDNTIMNLTSANINFQQYATSVEELSIIKERKRITREIHDTTGYALTNLMMMMEAATDLSEIKSAKLQTLLEQARDQACDALNETRRALRELREVELNKEHGLLAIHKLVKAFEQATNVRVKVDFGDVPWSFGDEMDLTVYRMVQEGITNAFKHGKATLIRLHFRREEPGIRINIRDNGCGCAEITEGIGFRGMRERIQQLEGSLKAQNRPHGFELSAWIPWKESA